MNRLLTSFTILLFLFSACNGDKGIKQHDIAAGAIFFDYKIRGEERDSNVTVYIQFRMGGSNGPAVELSDPAKVELDNETIPPDSARLTGAFYEIQKPSGSFTGKHTITFTGFDNKQYTEEFEYKPFTFNTTLPPAIYRGDIAFDFGGLQTEDYMRVAATDTSFGSKDIVEIDTVKNGHLIIPSHKLKYLVDGPITILLSRETDQPAKHGTKAGGRIIVSYGLQREFELKSSR